MCVNECVRVCLCSTFSLSLSLSVCLCFSQSFSVFLCLSQSFSVSLSLSLSLSRSLRVLEGHRTIWVVCENHDVALLVQEHHLQLVAAHKKVCGISTAHTHKQHSCEPTTGHASPPLLIHHHAIASLPSLQRLTHVEGTASFPTGRRMRVVVPFFSFIDRIVSACCWRERERRNTKSFK